ncbi:MAG: LPP20 family lipoprotein [Bacteroidota bacterium]
MKQVFQLILISLILISCSAGKKVSHDDLMASAPEWVRKTPNDPQYFHGIGAASKSTQMDFREKAKQNALSDIAGNISVNISSSSVLSQFEFDNKFSSYFRDNIKLSTKNYLEGYEMVENWETPDRYWVYYRLSKSEYERIKKERIQTAISKSEGDYREAEKSINAGNSAEAIYNQIKAIEKIKDFLGEDLRSEIAGKGQSYTSRLFADLTTTLQNIRIVYPVNPIDVKRGQKPENETLNAVVENERKTHLTGVPVIITYSFSPGKRDELVSDASGTIRIKTGSINSKLKTENISAIVNFDKMVRETTPDPVVRKLLSKIKAMEFVLPVNIVPSVFFVEAVNSRILQEIQALLTGDGFSVAPNSAGAGFILSIDANTTKGSERNGKFSAMLTADFVVKDKNGQMIFNQHITDITGLGASYEDASTDAYTALISRIRISVYPSMYKQIFKN